MSSSESFPPPQHAPSGSTVPQLPEPSHAERSRTLFSLNFVGTLSTWSRKHAGFPFGSLMPFALDLDGRPTFLISSMATHTQNLKTDPRASLFVGPAADEADPLGAARATLVGNAEPVTSQDLASVREQYLSRHENSRYWVDFADFSFFRLEPLDLYYVGGFGVMGWVSASDYAAAAPDPLASVAKGIIDHLNIDHGNAMLLLAQTHSGIHATEASITSVDRLGFSLRLKTLEGMKGTRINFLGEVTTAEQARAMLVQMVSQARSPS